MSGLLKKALLYQTIVISLLDQLFNAKLYIIIGNDNFWMNLIGSILIGPGNVIDAL